MNLKHFIFVVIFLPLFQAKSQVVFCPPGAEWNYLFFFTATGNPQYQKNIPEKVKYVRDSIVDGKSVKVLKHNNFYMSDNLNVIGHTLIKQSGDTIFFRNSRTQHTWQVFVNFAAVPGDAWPDTVLNGTNIQTIYQHTVISTGTVNINGFTLKEITVQRSAFSTFTFRERLGWSTTYLFNFPGCCNGDADIFKSYLCYSDSAFGRFQFSNLACDYGTGLNEQEIKPLNIFPNPASEFLDIEFGSAGIRALRVLDLFGRTVVEQTEFGNSTKLDVSGLSRGIYFIECSSESNASFLKKFIKG